MIFISFDLNSFSSCINYFESDSKYYKSATELSKTGNGKSCVNNDDIFMISLEEVQNEFLSNRIRISREQCSDCKKNKCKNHFDHCVVDAFYIDLSSNEMYLIEFKYVDIFDKYDISDRGIRKVNEIFSEIKDSLDDYQLAKVEEIVSHAKDAYADDHSCSIKLKAYESLYSIIPHTYKEYCLEKNIDVDIDGFKEFLLKLQIHYILAYKFDDPNGNKARNRIRIIRNLVCKDDPRNVKRIRDFSFNSVCAVKGTSGFNNLFGEIM